MAIKADFKSYRDELVEIIKDCGKELIERAEEMVGEGASYIQDFNINIYIPNPNAEGPTISWDTSTICKNYLNRRFGLTLKGEQNEKSSDY